MNIYSVISKFYDLIDILYFRRKVKSPRHAMLDWIPDDNIKILDVCTGTATNSIMIAENKKNTFVYGIDISKDMLNIADKKILERNIKNIKTYLRDATKTEFDPETFDVVVISLILHEISDELAHKILTEAKRVLKQNGRIIVVEWEEPNNFFQKFMFLFIRLLEPKGFNKFLKCDFENYFQEKGLFIQNIKHCDYSRVFEVKK